MLVHGSNLGALPLDPKPLRIILGLFLCKIQPKLGLFNVFTSIFE